MAINLETENLVHMNTHYTVVFIPPAAREVGKAANGFPRDSNYEVRNTKYDTCEYRSDSIVMALSIAEHYNRVLQKRIYLDEEEGSQLILDTFADESPQGGTVQ